MTETLRTYPFGILILCAQNSSSVFLMVPSQTIHVAMYQLSSRTNASHQMSCASPSPGKWFYGVIVMSLASMSFKSITLLLLEFYQPELKGILLLHSKVSSSRILHSTLFLILSSSFQDRVPFVLNLTLDYPLVDNPVLFLRISRVPFQNDTLTVSSFMCRHISRMFSK